MGLMSGHITPLVINSLRAGHTTLLTSQSHSKKPGMCQPSHAPGLKYHPILITTMRKLNASKDIQPHSQAIYIPQCILSSMLTTFPEM